MSKRISPTTIGAFVVGAAAIAVAVVVIVGGGKLFRHPTQFICMFQGSLNGLKIGAPVKFRGVQIGTVNQIRIRLSDKQGRERQDVQGLWLPVIIDIDPGQIVSSGGTGEALSQNGYEQMIKRGLRAQLGVESLLTGLLYVDLDIHQGKPANFIIEPNSGPYREIPTVPTNIQEIQEQATQALAKLDRIDFNALVTSITEAANSIKEVTSDPSIKATLDGLKQTTLNLDKTLTAVRAAVDNANTKIDPLVASLQKSSDEASATMKDTRAAVAQLDSTLDSDSPLSVNLNRALDQLSSTTRSVGELTDYLQRNPSSLIRGKYLPEKDR